MNIKLYQNKRGKPEVYKVQGFLEEILTNSGDSGDTIKELKQLLDNQSRALSLIITKMAEDGKVSAKDISDLDAQWYYEDAEFEN